MSNAAHMHEEIASCSDGSIIALQLPDIASKVSVVADKDCTVVLEKPPANTINCDASGTAVRDARAMLRLPSERQPFETMS